VNLKNPAFADLYKTVSVEINGKKPGEKITQTGEPMIYGITIPTNSPNRDVALAFVRFLLTKEKGMAILARLGQPSVIPSAIATYDKIPEELKPFASK
jgi:molybdate/tungstate transport system substrate-binding protein